MNVGNCNINTTPFSSFARLLNPDWIQVNFNRIGLIKATLLNVQREFGRRFNDKLTQLFITSATPPNILEDQMMLGRELVDKNHG